MASLREQLDAAHEAHTAQSGVLRQLQLRERLRRERQYVEGDGEEGDGERQTEYDAARIEAEEAHSSYGLLLLCNELQARRPTCSPPYF